MITIKDLGKYDPSLKDVLVYIAESEMENETIKRRARSAHGHNNDKYTWAVSSDPFCYMTYIKPVGMRRRRIGNKVCDLSEKILRESRQI